jgi:hypothetical protein
VGLLSGFIHAPFAVGLKLQRQAIQARNPMKKALEAGIFYKMTWTEPVHGNKDIVQKMERIVCIEPLDDEPDKPEPQGSVDWNELNKILMETFDYNDKDTVLTVMKATVSQWLHPKPAIDPEIKRVYEKYNIIYEDDVVGPNHEIFQALKAHCEK